MGLLFDTRTDGHNLGIFSEDISACAMNSRGVKTLLLGGIDYGKTKLLSHWRLEKMMNYIHNFDHLFLK